MSRFHCSSPYRSDRNSDNENPPEVNDDDVFTTIPNEGSNLNFAVQMSQQDQRINQEFEHTRVRQERDSVIEVPTSRM